MPVWERMRDRPPGGGGRSAQVPHYVDHKVVQEIPVSGATAVAGRRLIVQRGVAFAQAVPTAGEGSFKSWVGAVGDVGGALWLGRQCVYERCTAERGRGRRR